MSLREKPDQPGTVPEAGRRPPAVTSTELEPEVDTVTPDPAERALLERVRGGDPDACRQLVEDHQRAIRRLAMRMLHCDRDTADDVCQEVFLRAFRGLPTFTGEVRVGIWLHTIATNACITEYRKRRTLKRGSHRTLSIDAPLCGNDDLHIDPASREVDPGDRAGHQEFALRVREAVAHLPDDFRDAVVLRDVQNLSYEEISAILGVPPGTVRSRIHRGRLLLQNLLRGFAE